MGSGFTPQERGRAARADKAVSINAPYGSLSERSLSHETGA